MKKTILSLIVVISLASCGSNNNTVVNVADSTQAQVDTAAVTANDTTVAHIEAGAAKETPEHVK